MDSIIYEICEMIISKNDTKKSIEFNEKFAERNLSKITGRDNFKLGVKAGIRLALEVFSND